MSKRRIGRLLVDRGVLTKNQLQEVLTRQSQTGETFGKVASQMFDVDEQAIWLAWGQQMAEFLPYVELTCEPNNPVALQALTHDEAVRMLALPLRYENSKLIVATTAANLPAAMAYLQPKLNEQVRFVIADRKQIESFLARRYQCEEPCAG